MSEKCGIISLGGYIKKAEGSEFIVPEYQRGYIWGKKRSDSDKDSAVNLIDNIIDSWKSGRELFLQGITVSETKEGISLIDGQQRTTCLYIILKYLGFGEEFKLDYKVRKESEKCLMYLVETLKSGYDEKIFAEKPNEEYQDVFFFKKTFRAVHERFKDIDKKELLNYLLQSVKFLYILIDERYSFSTFKMMNGNKAQMKWQELLKAEMLRVSSLPDDESTFGDDWMQCESRRRLAHEWDRWLYWWNNEATKAFYNISGDAPLGLLLSTYIGSKKGMTKPFEYFKGLMGGEQQKARQVFYGLRKLQKRFEDTYNDPVESNKVGAILRIASDKDKFIDWYFCSCNKNNLERYYRLCFLGATHEEIIGFGNESKKSLFERRNDMREVIDDSDVYESDGKEWVYKFLFTLSSIAKYVFSNIGFNK